MTRRLLLCFLLLMPLAVWAEDEEDFEITEEGKFFDHSRTGLLYRRKLYVEGDDVTQYPYVPTYYNDTRDIGAWRPFISHWEQDPPSFITLWLYDDRPFNYVKAEVDLKVIIGHYDRDSNMVPANQVLVTNIPIENGMNRIPININNYKGDIVWVRLVGVRQKMPITPIEPVDDE